MAAQTIALAGIRERALTSRLKPDDPPFLDYLRLRMARRDSEMLIGFFAALDGSLICERTLAEAEGHFLVISAASILRVAVAVGAAKIVLVHNHPSGIARASRSDRLATKELTQRGEALDIVLLDHLIVGGSQIYSMKLKRLM